MYLYNIIYIINLYVNMYHKILMKINLLIIGEIDCSLLRNVSFEIKTEL